MRIGVDWGGTKIEVAALAVDGSIIWRKRKPTPKQDYEGCIEVVRDLVSAAERDVGRAGSVGMGIPGSISPATGLIRNANSTWLNNRPLQRDVEAALQRPVQIANDANCLAHSEAVDGAARGKRCVFGVIIGTGVGGGISFNGEPYHGASGIAGEWGHTPLPARTADDAKPRTCWCGRIDCLETFLSGPAFERDYANVAGESLVAAAIAERIAGGEHEALAVFERYLERMSRALAVVVNLLDPDAIVIGGGMSNIESLYLRLPGMVRAHVFSDEFMTPIMRAVHGDSSGVRGAAWLQSRSQS